MKRKALSLVVAAAFALTAVPFAVSAEYKADEARKLFEDKCGVCHGLDRPLSKNKDKEGWESTVNRMQQKSGSGISEDEAATIARYLSEIQGPK